MRDMMCANNGCCGLSRGTQSDGLISDTSTEEFASDSSTENLKGGKLFGKPVAKEIKEVCNGLKNSIHLKPSSISLHGIQTQCRLYIRWGVLLSFGILLWVALWITDIFKPNPFLKEGWLADLATAKKVTLKAAVSKNPRFISAGWFFNVWSYACDSLISVTTLEILIFLSFILILICLEYHTKNNLRGTVGKLCYDQFYKSLLNAGGEQSETDNSNFHLNMLQEELIPKEPPERRNCDDCLSRFGRGDVRNLMIPDKIKVESNLGRSSTRYLNRGETSLTENCVPKSLKRSHNLSSTRKRPLQLKGGKNYCNFSLRSNNLSQDFVTRKLILEELNSDSSAISVAKNEDTKDITEQSNLTCSVFNKSRSFMSEEIQTWFEIPNSDQTEEVMHSFDVELKEFFETKKSSPALPRKKRNRDLQPPDQSSTVCDCSERSKAVVLNVNHNGGIISSSPAFRRFLINLAEDQLSESYL